MSTPEQWSSAETWLDRNHLIIDVALAAVALVLLSVPVLGFSNRPADWIASIVMPAAMALRRARPAASAAVVHAGALLHFTFGSMLLPVDVLLFASVYSVTVHGPLWARRAALSASLLGSFLLPQRALLGRSGWGLWDASEIVLLIVMFLAVGAMVVTAWAVGLLRRSRMNRAETLAERARRLEVERDQQAQLAAAAERARIAREMHDIVAHSLSVVIAQADGGRYAAQSDPEAAVKSLGTISETGRAALADMRRILGVLRADGSDFDSAATAPQPADHDLEELVRQVRGSGVEVSLVRLGAPRPLPPGVSLTVYRICQESLTNVLKHAGPQARATVLVQWTPQHLLLQVDDDGRGAAAPTDGRGHGVLGMRERAALFGGVLSATPRPGGGFRVQAKIPVPAAGAQPTRSPYQPQPDHHLEHP